ncbi:MAG: TolC family protein [Candidatus Amulumruptor sp.]|nr:TolC family protein [Candidatus Amulumruptor sp.]
MHSKHHIIIAMALLIGSALTAAGQQLTLRDCLIYARDHAHSNVVSRLDAEGARLDARTAAAGIMPRISLSGNGNMSFGRNIDPETNTYDNKRTLSTAIGLNMSLPLFDGLVSINNLKASRANARRQAVSAQIERDRVSLLVIKAFYNVSYHKALVAQMEQQLQRDRGNLAATVRGLELGIKSVADTAEVYAIVAADEYELTNQRSLLAKAYLTLRSEAGMELTDEPLDLIEEPTYTATDTVLPEADPSFIHPRIAEATEKVSESRYSLRAARGSYSPTLSLSAGISTSYYRMMGSKVEAPDFSRQWHDNMGQYVGLSLSIPLFDGFATINRARRASVNLRRSRAELEQARYDTAREETEAALDLASANEEYSSAKARYTAEQAAYAAVERKFQLGAASAIDLYAASAKLATARATLEGKRIQSIINRITLDYYRGIPFIH